MERKFCVESTSSSLDFQIKLKSFCICGIHAGEENVNLREKLQIPNLPRKKKLDPRHGYGFELNAASSIMCMQVCSFQGDEAKKTKERKRKKKNIHVSVENKKHKLFYLT